MAVARFAIKGRVGRDQDALDHRTVSKAPEEFLCGVTRTLLADKIQRVEGVAFRKLRPEAARQIGHRVPRRGAPAVKPMQELRGTVTGLLPLGKLRMQL
jgi:hypothetical protein